MFEDLKTLIKNEFAGISNISPEGKKISRVGIYILAAGILLLLFGLSAGKHITIIGALFYGFCRYFFRDPERNTSFGPDEIVCPADGRVLSIRSEGDPSVTVLRIFLSVFDVHVQRATMDGTIGAIKYTHGSFAFANNAEADKNERNLIEISDGARFAHVEQITGAIARRISCWVKTGDKIKAGQHVGLIYFGSQVAVYLPSSARIIVKPGQKVEGAITVLGLWKN